MGIPAGQVEQRASSPAPEDASPWRSAHELRLHLSGRVITTGTSDDGRDNDELTDLTCILRVGRGKATVVSVE